MGKGMDFTNNKILKTKPKGNVETGEVVGHDVERYHRSGFTSSFRKF